MRVARAVESGAMGERPDSERAYRVMGILNVTPDSFSDGGEWFAFGQAGEAGRALGAQGAAILDVGGESPRPGSDPVPEPQERERVVPVIAALAAAAAVHPPPRARTMKGGGGRR